MSSFLVSETIRCSVYLQQPEVFLDSIELYQWDKEEKAHSNKPQKLNRLDSGRLLTYWELEGEREEQFQSMSCFWSSLLAALSSPSLLC